MMELFGKYDVVECEISYRSGSVQNKKRPYIIVSNVVGTKNATIVTVMPLTHIIKRLHLPVHECIEAETDNGLKTYSMILGEQPQTIDKREIIRKVGTVTNVAQRNTINKVCYNSFFFGEDIDWKEVFNGNH